MDIWVQKQSPIVTEILLLFSLEIEAMPGSGDWCEMSGVSRAMLKCRMSSNTLISGLGNACCELGKDMMMR